MNSDFIPHRFDAFNVWFRHLTEYTVGKTSGTSPLWWHIPQAAMMDFLSVADDWSIAYQAAVDAPSTPTRNERKRVYKVTVKAVRAFVNRFLRCEPVTNMQRDEAGIPNHDAIPSHHLDPDQLVDFILSVVIAAHLVIAHYRIAGSDTRGKGDFHGAEVRVWVLPVDAPAPISADHPGWVSFSPTSSPWEHTFLEGEIGMRMYICMRWVNNSTGTGGNDDAGKGPWSSIQTLLIP
jgi:hypothetical protein